jgi:hypothetical protein
MMNNPDASIVHADPMHFSEFVDQNGLVCFQTQSDFSFQQKPRMPILRVSREVWLGIHDESVSLNDQPLTPDEQIIEQMKILVDQRNRRTPKSVPRFEPTTETEYEWMLSDALERQVWDLRLERVVFGDVAQRRDREIKIGSLFVKYETEWKQNRIKHRPQGYWNGRYFIPLTGV